MILRIDNPPDTHHAREAILRAHLPRMRENGDVVVMGPGREDKKDRFESTNCPRPMAVAVFDLDATLIPCEFVDELAAHRGLAHLTRPLTARAMAGEIDFRESYTARIALLAGSPIDEIDQLIDSLPLAPGAEEFVDSLRAAGCKTAIVTGGYARLGRAIQARLEFDALYATELEERGGALTGRLAGTLMDEEGKAAALRDFCARSGCTPADALAVGDGANDLKMLAEAGTAILYTSMPATGRTITPMSALKTLR